MRRIFWFLFLASSHIFAEENFWKLIEAGHYSKDKKIEQTIEGKVTFLKKHIRARDNYYLINIQDPNGDLFVEIKIYTIKRLKRINDIECQEGDVAKVKGKILLKRKSKKIGTILIDKPAEYFSCNKQL